MSIDQIFLRKLGFLDKILSKKTILSISNKVYEDLKASKARQTSPMTKKALDANELSRSRLELFWSLAIFTLLLLFYMFNF